MPDRGFVERTLRMELQVAQDRFDIAAKMFNEVIKTPSELPHPDGTRQVLNAGREQRHATRLLRETLQRWNSFILYGNVPPIWAAN